MPPLAWSFTKHVPAPPQAVFEWMSDFSEDDHARPAFRRGAGMTSTARTRATRTIVENVDESFTIRDEWGRRMFESQVTVHAAAREVRIARGFGYSAVWRAVAEGAGTRVEVEGRLSPRGVAQFLVPLFARGMVKELRADFNGHVADLEDFLGVSRA